MLPFARHNHAGPEGPKLDVCLVKGEQRRRYLIAPVTASTWESRIEAAGGGERRLVSRAEALRQKAQFELQIATEIGAGWAVEWNR